MTKEKDAIEFLRGDVATRHLHEALQHGLAFQLSIRQGGYDPTPSAGDNCTDAGICTAGLPCLITERAGRTGCDPTGPFRPDCAVLKA
jgi:hypothetical protein